jgi:hypothetical protein
VPILIGIAIFFGLLSLIFLALGIAAARRKKLLGTAADVTVALLMLSLSALFGVIAVSTQGYRALVREETAAWVSTTPTGPQSFAARVRLPDGTERTYALAGDQFYIDAHILKWKPMANMLGLHTQYELDRISGRYMDLNDEQAKPRSVFGLGTDGGLDMFSLRQRFPLLRFLVDAEYGSASFIETRERGAFQVRVSTSGLLIRKTDSLTGGTDND